MADLALGAIGVVGLAVQGAQKSYEFLSSVRGAPRPVKSLAKHARTLRVFLEELSRRLSNPEVSERLCNEDFLHSTNEAVDDCRISLERVDDEVRFFVKYAPGSTVPQWGGRGLRRRVLYAFKKTRMLELQNELVRSMQTLDLMLPTLDLSRVDTVRAPESASTEGGNGALQRLETKSSEDGQLGATTHTDEAYWDAEHAAVTEDDQSRRHDIHSDNPFETEVLVQNNDGSSQSMQALVDSGAERNYISLSALQSLRLGGRDSSLTTSSESSSAIKFSGDLKLSFAVSFSGPRRFNMDFTIINDTSRLLRNAMPTSIILGRKWIRSTFDSSSKLWRWPTISRVRAGQYRTGLLLVTIYLYWELWLHFSGDSNPTSPEMPKAILIFISSAWLFNVSASCKLDRSSRTWSGWVKQTLMAILWVASQLKHVYYPSSLLMCLSVSVYTVVAIHGVHITEFKG